MVFKGPSPAARDLTVTTFLESGNMKFIPALFLSSEEISEIVNKTALGEMDTSVLDANLVDASQTGAQAAQLDPNGLEIVEVSGRNYFGKLMIVNDPSRVKVGTTYPFTEYGKNLDEIVTNSGGVAGVNGGLYDSLSLKGGYPWGVVISQGEVQYMDIDHDGLYIIGMDKNNLLQIIAIEGMSQAEVESLIAERGIRDCVCFQEEASDTNNHFVPLVINGEPRELGGLGSGANPRTVIGQRADGAILLLVTDGRGAQGHLGATASDLINIMIQHGAVNAANLDGGSSSCMYYNGAYEMTSVTLYYANASWLMPTAFVIEAR
ncbi:MAG: phosphodiester glycosidase family protein [Coriobacteriales bacterium]|nr:phosphodiester glycosidase family protein [Coriobacteriales bacterium]